MNMFQAVGSVFKKYAVFKGRARRREFWWFSLFNCLFVIVVITAAALFFKFSIRLLINSEISSGNFDSDAYVNAVARLSRILFMTLIGILAAYALITFLPGLAVTFRRLHDIGKSGAWAFLPLLLSIAGVLIAAVTSVEIFMYLPVAGNILLLVWECRDGDPYANAYGEDPKGREWRRPQERDESGCDGGTQGAAAGGNSPSPSAYTQPYTGASNSQNKKVWLSDNAEFRAKLAQAGDAEEVAGLFAEEGVKVTAAEAKAVRAYANANKSTAKTTRMNFFEAAGACFQKYAVFTGRAGRDEYGEFIWFCYIVSNFGNDLLENSVGSSEFVSILLTLFDALTLIPRLAVISRRLHDLGVSGAYMLTIYVPIVLGEVLYGLTSNVLYYLLLLLLGTIPLLILSFKDGEPFTNAYGPDPEGREMPNPANTQ